jgi:DNA replication protein DnaC
MEPIGETIKKITAATSKVNMEKSDNTKKKSSTGFQEPEVCPICGGIGYVRRDLPVDDPNFGLLEVCQCQKENFQRASVQRLYSISNLDAFQKMTFEHFNISGLNDQKEINKTLEVAFNTSQNYAHHLNGWLLLMGGYGCGKTHLAAAVANEVVSLGVETLFLTVPDLLDWLRYSFSSEETTYESRFEEIKNIRFLVLDDLGTQNTTAWAREKLFQIINHRYTHKLPTVITTNISLSEIDERVRSRLQDRELVIKIQIDAADFRNPLMDSNPSPISSLAHISDHRTFDKFSARNNEKLPADEQNSLDSAFFAAQQFAEHPDGWLVFMGTYGTGKTHLAAAIGHFRAAMGDDPIFAVVPDLLDHLRATFNPSSSVTYDNVFAQVRTAKLLILDDLGTQSATPWAREKLYQVLNYRYETRLPTVITTSSSLEEIDPRIRSRMLDERVCRVYKIIVPAYKTQSVKRRTNSKNS